MILLETGVLEVSQGALFDRLLRSLVLVALLAPAFGCGSSRQATKEPLHAFAPLPNQTSAHFKRAKTALEDKRPADSLSIVQFVENNQPLSRGSWKKARWDVLKARTLLALRRDREASSAASEALRVLRGTGDASDVVHLLLVRGLAKAYQNQKIQAREDFEAAEVLRDKMNGMTPREVDLLRVELGFALGEIDLAGRVLALSESFSDTERRRVEARIHRERGEWSRALESYGLALASNLREPDQDSSSLLLVEIAQSFLDLGQLRLAWVLSSFLDEEGIGELPLVRFKRTVLRGRIQEAWGDVREASRYYREALEIDDVSIHHAEVERFHARAGVWRLCASGACGPLVVEDPILPAALDTLSIPERRPPLNLETLWLSSRMAQTMVHRADRARASELLVRVERELTHVPLEATWRIHHEVGLAWRDLGRTLRSTEHFLQASESLEVARTRVKGFALREDFAQSHRAIHEALLDAHVGPDGQIRASEDLRLAFAAAEKMKSRGVLELLKHGHNRKAQAEIKHQRATGEVLRRLSLDEGSQALTNVVHLCELWTQGAGGPAPPSRDEFLPLLPQVQSALAQNTAMLAYVLGEQRSYLWLVRREGATLFSLPGAEVIEPVMRAYRETLLQGTWESQEARRKHFELGSKLGQMVLGPALSELKGIDRLVIAADGELMEFPFAALLLPEGQHKDAYLLHRFSTRHVPSAAVWLALRKRTRRVSRDALLAVGDPWRDPEHGGKGSLDVHVEFHDGSVTFITDGSAPALPDLRYSLREVQAVAQSARRRGKGAKLLTGSRATRKGVLQQDLSQYRYLHFATHGLTDADPLLPHEVMKNLKPEELEHLKHSEPALLLSSEPLDAGILRLDEVLNLDLSAKLVVLSACSTGRGWEPMGGSAFGLGGAFLFAGSEQVLVSVWSVADQQTSVLMDRFYRGLHRGLEADQALRQAQLSLLQRGSRRAPGLRGISGETSAPPASRKGSSGRGLAPFYWAPFVVLGE